MYSRRCCPGCSSGICRRAWRSQVTLCVSTHAWSTLYPRLARNPCDPLGTQDWRLVRINYGAISSSLPLSAVGGHHEVVSQHFPHPEGWPVFLHPHLLQSVAQVQNVRAECSSTLTLQHHHVAATQRSITRLTLHLSDLLCSSFSHSGDVRQEQGASTFGQSSICCGYVENAYPHK